MSKNKKVEHIIQSDKVYSTTGKDNAGNKSTSSSSSSSESASASSSSSPLHPIQQHHDDSSTTTSVATTAATEAAKNEQWQPGGIVQGSSSPPPSTSVVGLQATPEHMRGGATKDMFDLIERVQCSRIDDQRCVLPAYFSQVKY